MTTYSQSIAGVSAVGLFAVKNVTLADDWAPGPAQANAMQDGTAFLCKNPDGSQSYYQLDAERSTPGNPVLRKL
jgi:hypothetical protein